MLCFMSCRIAFRITINPFLLAFVATSACAWVLTDQIHSESSETIKSHSALWQNITENRSFQWGSRSRNQEVQFKGSRSPPTLLGFLLVSPSSTKYSGFEVDSTGTPSFRWGSTLDRATFGRLCHHVPSIYSETTVHTLPHTTN